MGQGFGSYRFNMVQLEEFIVACSLINDAIKLDEKC